MQDKNNKEAGWVYKPESTSAPSGQYDGAASARQESRPTSSGVSWSASEYVANPRNMGWFTGLGALAVIVAACICLISSDWVSTISVLVLAGAVGMFAARQPQVLQYAVDDQGIQVGQRQYPYSAFRSFSIVQEGAFNSISLMPLKRFMPPLAIHFDPNDEKKIIDALGDFLPYEEHRPDFVDSLSRRLRF